MAGGRSVARAVAEAATAVAAAAIAPPLGAQPGLTGVERHWLDAAAPVLADARASGLPLDVVVQPQPNAGEPPLALAWVGGRCKLVATMRGPGGAPLPPPDLDPAPAPLHVRAMVAHETGHCWRHVRGAWGRSPSGFAPAAAPRSPDDTIAAARLEEGFADLYALAWIAAHEPGAYAAVHAWLSAERAEPAHEGAEHDTRAWVAAAGDPAAFGVAGSPYERAERLWRAVGDASEARARDTD
jgi:hypothetical protein